MRLFVGIELSDDLRRGAAKAAERLRTRVGREAPRSVLRWVPDTNLHITVWFLGEVREAGVTALTAVLSEPLDVRAFTLRLGGAGAFPPSGPPRAIWLGLTAGRDRLLTIYEVLRQRLTPLGFQPEKRPYSPHLTIARVKDTRPADGAALRRITRDAPDDVGACEVRHATLFASRPTPAGSHYDAVLLIPLLKE